MIMINREEDVQKLLAEKAARDLESLRAGLRLDSLEDAKKRAELCRLACETHLKVLEEAYATLGEDPDDDADTAIEKAHKLEHIEHAHNHAIAAYEIACRRLNWEEAQANKK
jgi:hypothetical protein